VASDYFAGRRRKGKSHLVERSRICAQFEDGKERWPVVRETRRPPLHGTHGTQDTSMKAVRQHATRSEYNSIRSNRVFVNRRFATHVSRSEPENENDASRMILMLMLMLDLEGMKIMEMMS